MLSTGESSCNHGDSFATINDVQSRWEQNKNYKYIGNNKTLDYDQYSTIWLSYKIKLSYTSSCCHLTRIEDQK